MSFDPEIAAVRFGFGLGPRSAPVQSTTRMLEALRGADTQAAMLPIPGFVETYPDILEIRGLGRARRAAKDKGKTDFDAAQKALQVKRREMRRKRNAWFLASLSRASMAEDTFRERLVRFWSDHFTAIGKGNQFEYLGTTFTEDAIRPHIAGRFADMLKASSTHPVMLYYLDQFASAGENSKLAQKGKRSLNENLGREILELHTLGVEGGYTQTDVRAFANLLAGFTLKKTGKAGFDHKKGNPGAETVLGKSYGTTTPRVEDVMEALDDLARHPDTARHIARKLATHFVADTPDPDLVAQIEQAFLASDGDLVTVYEAMLDHPAAWSRDLQKVKQPFDFVASSLRALDVSHEALETRTPKERNLMLLGSLKLMGQAWGRPSGPDGWPEDARNWITPQGLAARIQWSMTAPPVLTTPLPDPREFVTTALGSLAGDTTLFAARAAETRTEGVGMILSSPEFQKR